MSDARAEAASVIERMVEVMNAHDLEGCVELYAKDAELQDPRIPGPGAREGLRARGIRYWYNAFPDVRITVNRMIVEAPDVAVEWTFEGTHLGEYMGIEPEWRIVPGDDRGPLRRCRREGHEGLQPVRRNRHPRARGAGRGPPGHRVKLFYASDIHGSETCWRKFLNAGPFYKADVIVMGGDVTGKGIVPVVRDPDSGTWSAQFKGRTHRIESEGELAELESRITFNGMYPYRCDREELERLVAAPNQEELFDGLMEETFGRWLDIGEARAGGIRRGAG